MRILLLSCVVGLLVSESVPCLGAAERPPNILFLMADDHAAHAIGAYGGRLAALNPTPTLDRLALEGTRLSNTFCTNSICVPSRATLLTGQFSHRNGVKTLSGSLPPERQMLPRLFHEAGYETALIGKWHLGAEPAAFDHYCVLPAQGSYFNPTFHAHPNAARVLPSKALAEFPNPLPAWPKNVFRFAGPDSLHADDAITELSLAWLKNRQDKNKPFFLMHHFKGPHDNFENAERYDFLYEDTQIPEPDSLRTRGTHGPLSGPQYGTSVSSRNTKRNMGKTLGVDPALPEPEFTSAAYQRYLKKFLRCVRGVDDNVARLLDFLRSTGELDRTVIIYTADQGFMLGEHDYIDKRWMYEESLRMPFLVRHPKTIPAGRVMDTPVTNVDFAPTLLAMAGIAASGEMQGRNFLPLLQGQPTPAAWSPAVYYRYWMHMASHDNPAHYGIRTPDYKLIFFYGLPLDAVGAVQTPTPPHWELYDLRNDPQEMRNLYGEPALAETVRQLKQQLADLKTEHGDSDSEYPELLDRLKNTP
jgi:arylsulfatase A-like enzyme